MSPVAFIPARGGSQRLPRKALADLGGKPLLAWTIAAAQASGIFGDIVVCSEDPAILDAAHHFGAWAVPRPPALAADDVTVESVLQWYQAPGPVYVLLPTSPFRSAASIRAAWAAFQATDGAAGLLSVVPTEPPEHALRVASGRILCGELFAIHRARLVPAYRHDGGHQIVTRSAGPVLAFHAPADETLDINTPQDLEWARWTLSRRTAAAI